MTSLLERKLIVVTGKGGAGKTTMACALGLLAARGGLRTVVAELGDQQRLPALFDHAGTSEPGEEVELEHDLWSTSIDPDRALIEWLRTVGGRISMRMLAASSTFHYFAAAAPGAKELVCMIKARELCERQPTREDQGVYDLLILDAPATGHALAMLSSPQTFGAIVRAGPLAEQTGRVRELLGDPERSGYVAVAHATEMAVTETLELEEGLRLSLDRDLDAVVVNGTVPRRFTREELGRIARLDENSADTATHDAHRAAGKPPGDGDRGASDLSVVHSAARAARTVHERARLQQSQIARLRRQRFAEGLPPKVLTVPLLFTPDLDLAAVREIATRLDRKL
jgi:anion-transporting  ArsA/GET3 family ATPase